jgi:hypothetical protein
MQPILFFAYANSQSSPLPLLSREDDTVYSVLVNRYLKGHYAIHRDSFTSLEKINQYLGKFQDQIALFHYSGHADEGHLLLDDENANAKGIAHQLGTSAKNGKLQVVILNGCSTGGQVQALLDAGVPAVVATSAPVGDASATEFAIRFYQGLSEYHKTLQEAFDDALGPAQTSTTLDLNLSSISRGQQLPTGVISSEALWGLFVREGEDAILSSHPIPRKRNIQRERSFEPNSLLTESLFASLLATKCREIRNLQEAEEDGEYVEVGNKQTAIVNVLPFPIATHLQKLLCPVESEGEGFDKISLARLQQIGTAFHSSTELLTFVMLSQLWEARLNGVFKVIPADLQLLLQQHFSWSARERAAQEHIPIVQAIRRFLDSLPAEEGAYPYFVEELKGLKALIQAESPFAKACTYLAHLRRQTLEGTIAEEDIPDLCEAAEIQLCAFFSELGFLHRYALTSIQNIDIRKLRHQKQAVFRHELVKLMRAFGRGEQIYYDLEEYLDNRGVVLVKGKVKVLDAKKREFTADDLDYLNLTPFLIDQNAFEKNTDLSNLLFFEEYRKNSDAYLYHSVKRPESRNDKQEVLREGPYGTVSEQLLAYQQEILEGSGKPVANG